MNSAQQATAGHPEWDMPKDGDFARYVDRLTAAHVVRLPEEPGRVPHFGEARQRGAGPGAARAPTAPTAPTARTDLQALNAPAAGVLGIIELGLVLLAVLQVALLALAGVGSAVGVAVAIFASWVVRRWKRALGAGADAPRAPAAASLVALRQQLQALAQHRPKTSATK